MKEYLEKNKTYWEKGYEADNVESFVFRTYGRIFKYEFNLSGKNHEKLLDFGCGEGSALKFFESKGFDVYGVDISQVDIDKCKQKMVSIKNHFITIPPAPLETDIFFGGDFDIIIAVQSLYYYSESDLETRLQSFYNQMKPGAILFATMMGAGHYMYNRSQPYKDGLRKISFTSPRLQVNDYFVNFTLSKDMLLKKFRLFEKIHIGFYDAVYREGEGGSYHYTFIGRKPV